MQTKYKIFIKVVSEYKESKDLRFLSKESIFTKPPAHPWYTASASGERHARIRTLRIARRAIHLLPRIYLHSTTPSKTRSGENTRGTLEALTCINPFTAEQLLSSMCSC